MKSLPSASDSISTSVGFDSDSTALLPSAAAYFDAGVGFHFRPYLPLRALRDFFQPPHPRYSTLTDTAASISFLLCHLRPPLVFDPAFSEWKFLCFVPLRSDRITRLPPSIPTAFSHPPMKPLRFFPLRRSEW